MSKDTVKITFDYEISSSMKTEEMEPGDFAYCSSKEHLELALIAEGDEMAEFSCHVGAVGLDELWRRVEDIRRGEVGAALHRQSKASD